MFRVSASGSFSVVTSKCKVWCNGADWSNRLVRVGLGLLEDEDVLQPRKRELADRAKERSEWSTLEDASAAVEGFPSVSFKVS